MPGSTRPFSSQTRRALATAVSALARGQIVVYPTDTLYGLGGRASSLRAVNRVLEAKERPGGAPLSIAVSSTEEIEPIAELTAPRRSWIRRMLPGPVTVILPASTSARRRLASPVFGAGGTIGVRVPNHPIARELARLAGPITCTSANLHGRPPCDSLAAARRTFGEAVGAYVDGDPKPSGSPSMIVDLTRDVPAFVPRGNLR
jgi:L-threonylcarbamoyladenylate synthase